MAPQARPERRRKSPEARQMPCFLCKNPIRPEDLEEAYERVLSDEAPARADYAHAECAEQAGFWDQPEPEENEGRRAR